MNFLIAIGLLIFEKNKIKFAQIIFRPEPKRIYLFQLMFQNMRCLTAVSYARRATAGKYGCSEVQPSETAYSVLSEAKPEPERSVPKGWRELIFAPNKESRCLLFVFQILLTIPFYQLLLFQMRCDC